MSYKLFFDGGQKKNVITYGIILMEDDKIIFRDHGDHKDPALSNNVAEYIALAMGMIAALERGIKILEVFGDSKLIIEQMNESYRVSAATMKPCYAFCKILQKQFEQITFTWVPREQNKEADREGR